MDKIDDIEIKELDNGLISIVYEGDIKGDVKVYYGLTPNTDIKNKKLLVTMSSKKIIIQNPCINKRVYYVLTLENRFKYLAAPRLINLEGTNNFRDIGGYKTKDGKTLRWGLIFRSDQLSHLTLEDIKFLEDMGLKSIIDFRSEAEAEAAKNKSIQGTKTYHLDPHAKVAQLAAGSIDDKNKKNKTTIELLKNNEFDPDEYGDPRENMFKEYRKFINSHQSQKAYRKVMKLVMDRENLPLVLHCRGGKDRTGFAVAIILLALGVDEESIIKDYELTTQYRSERNKKQMNLYKQYTDDPKILTLLSTMQESKGEYMQEAINEMKRAHGSVDLYLEKVLGINNDIKHKLKNILLY